MRKMKPILFTNKETEIQLAKKASTLYNKCMEKRACKNVVLDSHFYLLGN